MVEVRRNVNLKQLNSLGVEANAAYFIELENSSQILEAVNCARELALPVQVLGGGSNLILTAQINALILHMKNKGIQKVGESESNVLLSVQAGENWHEFVQWSVDNGLSGIENLAYIPGSVGAAPVQNIGAYGVEVENSIEQVLVYDLVINKEISLSNSDCGFSYRDSLFKSSNNRYVILSVTFRLSKKFNPVLDYGPLQRLKEHNDLKVTDVFNKIIEIRCEKLPSPVEIPNAGSFFKNPIVELSTLEKIKSSYPDVVHFPYFDDYKLAAGWLIDQAGFKGKQGVGGVGCYHKQALVIVNPEHAPAVDILQWATEVSDSVKLKFGVALEIEPRIW